MSYFKCVNGGYITCIGKGNIGTSISEEEYNAILAIVRSKPAKDGYDFRLKEDLTWEEYEVEPPEDAPEEELTAEEIAAAIEEVLA